MRSARPGFTFLLMLLAALAMLGGGVHLARRTVEERRPADRTLLRETAAALQGEAARLESVYIDHLRRIGGLVLNEVPDAELAAAGGAVRGLGFIAVVSAEPGQRRSVRLAGQAHPAPEPVLTAQGQRPAFASQMAVPAEIVFNRTTEEMRRTFEGWLPVTHDGWLAWWRRFDDRHAAVFVIRKGAVQAAVAENLDALLDTAWAPVRAAGEAARVTDERGGALRSAGSLPGRESDFILPLTCRFGSWHVEAWDRRALHTVHDQTTLTAAGLAALAVALLGWIVAAQQRRALREARAQVSFVNRVSHELGTPLTNLQLYLELARDALPAEASEESMRRIDIALEETARLSRLAGNVLTHARGESGRLQLRPGPCRPAEVIAGVLEQFAPALQRRGIAVETDFQDELTTLADADALTQIAGNLISNVEKYAASGGWMRIAVKGETAEGVWRLRIEDRGPGIPRGDAERIFEPFERLDTRITEGITGTGLGLAIARDLARRMGGEVRIDFSAADEPGAVFEAVLPMAGPPAARAAAAVSATDDEAQPEGATA